eukprot:1858933-Rhodomonas_salina.1
MSIQTRTTSIPDGSTNTHFRYTPRVSTHALPAIGTDCTECPCDVVRCTSALIVLALQWYQQLRARALSA